MARIALPGPQVTRLRTETLSHRVGAAGLCSDSNDDRWFPAEPGHTATDKKRQDYEEHARAACLGCVVMDECRELALRGEARPGVKAHGVWGGLAPWQRDALRRRRRTHTCRAHEVIGALARSYGLAAEFDAYDRDAYGPGAWHATISLPTGAAVLKYDSRARLWTDPATGGEVAGDEIEAHLQRAAEAVAS